MSPCPACGGVRADEPAALEEDLVSSKTNAMGQGEATVVSLLRRPWTPDNRRRSGRPGMCETISRLARERGGKANPYPSGFQLLDSRYVP